jgi:chemotaxis protein MotB
MADDPGEKPRGPLLIIFKKKKVKDRHAGGAHGGSWKIAYADFVTAMMAFFLLMWLLTSTNQGDLQGIADYFNRPLQSVFQQGPGANATSAPNTPSNSQEEQRKLEREGLERLKAKIDALIEANPKLNKFKNQIKTDITSEGLRIQIVDDKNRPMFDQGNAALKGYTNDILRQIGLALNGVDNRISIAGHTDAVRYSAGESGYSNWDLSADRANAARRALIAGGMQEQKLLQIRGLADALPLVKSDPKNPSNRRISIVVMNAQSVKTFQGDGQGVVQVGPSAPLVLPSVPGP